MSLREEIEKRRAEEGYVPNPCYTKKDHVVALRVETSGGEVFLAASPQHSSFELFLRQRLDLQRIEGTCLAA